MIKWDKPVGGSMECDRETKSCTIGTLLPSHPFTDLINCIDYEFLIVEIPG